MDIYIAHLQSTVTQRRSRIRALCRRRQFVSAAAADFDKRLVAVDNLSVRRRCHLGVLNYFVVFFMLCMISQCKIKVGLDIIFSPAIRANVRIAEFDLKMNV